MPEISKKNKFRFYLFLLLIFSGCDGNEKKFSGLWLINEAYYNNQITKLDLSSNAFQLSSNQTCSLPISLETQSDSLNEDGTWTIHTENDVLYLTIKTKNKIFDKDFKIASYTLTKQLNSQVLPEMILIADSLKLKCTRLDF